MYPSLCSSLGIPYRQCGALVIALDSSERTTLEALKKRGEENGIRGLEILERDAVLSLEPALNPQVLCALYVPTSAIVSPYETAFALADEAAQNGVSFRFDEPVLSVSQQPGGSFIVSTPSCEYHCSVLVNCAGASGAEIHNQLSPDKLTIIHRRGQYYLLDRAAVQPFSRTIFQCPSDMGKGVLISPTVHGNLLLGPTAEDIDDPMDTATTSEGLSNVLDKARRTWPQLSVRNNITNFSGVRAHLSSGDFIVGPCAGISGYYEAIGIESPGLSAAPAIGEDLAKMISDDLCLESKKQWIPLSARTRSFHDMSDRERAEAVSDNPAYGNIICRCEMVTEAEIRAAVRRPVGARSVDGVKRRTRAGMGCCQGGFCLPLAEITKNGGKSLLLSGTVESFLKGADEHD